MFDVLKLKSKNAIQNWIFALIFLFCVRFCKYPFFSVVALATFAIYFVTLIKIYGIVFVKYFYILFVTMASIVSCAFIEFYNFYLNELQMNSNFKGSLPLLLFSYWILYQVIILIDQRYTSKLLSDQIDEMQRTENKILDVICLAVLFVVSLCFMKVIAHPAFVYHLERADYAKYYGLTGVWSQLAVNIPRIMIFPFVLMITKKGRARILGVSCTIVASFYYLWTGNKFGMFFQMLYVFLLVLADYIMLKLTKHQLIKIIRYVLMAFVILVTITLVIQSITYNGNILIYFIRRISAQGQLWWNMFSIDGDGLHMDEFGDEIISYFHASGDVRDNIGANYGIYKMMYLSLPQDSVDAYLAAGYRYTEAGYASMFYYFGFAGPIIYACIMGAFFAFTINNLSTALRQNKYFSALVHIRFLLLGTTSFSMFIFTPFFSMTSIILFLYLLVTHNKKIVLKKPFHEFKK